MKKQCTASIAAFLVVLILAGCGGGGGGGGSVDTPAISSPSPTPAPLPSATGSISGNVQTSSGAVLSGVQVALSGPSSSTTVSSAGGAYTFGNLGAGAYTLTASAAGLTFTPATVSVAVNGVAVTAASFTRVFPSTQQIADYMAILHTQSLGTFTTSEQALSNKLASQGLYGSGTHYVQSGQAYVAIVQTFVNGSLAFVQQKAQTMAIDRDAVAGQFTAYAAQDAAYASSYYSGVNWGLTGSGLATFIAGNNSSTNAAYALAVLQLP